MEGYDASKYPPFAVTADVVLMTILDGELHVLLVERGGEPFAGSWALPGGFLNPDEDALAAARRELVEETGVEVSPQWHLEELRTYSAPDRDPRMRVVSVAHLCLTPESFELNAGSDAAAVRWWPVSRLAIDGRAGTPLAFDHAQIISDGLERVCAKLEYTTVAAAFCPEKFTIPELRSVYEAVWGVDLEPANFHRKVVAADGFVVPTGEFAAAAGVGRRSQLYVRGDVFELDPPFRRTMRPR